MVDCFIDYITWIDFDKFTMVNLGNSFAMRSCSGYESVSGIRNPGYALRSSSSTGLVIRNPGLSGFYGHGLSFGFVRFPSLSRAPRKLVITNSGVEDAILRATESMVDNLMDRSSELIPKPVKRIARIISSKKTNVLEILLFFLIFYPRSAFYLVKKLLPSSTLMKQFALEVGKEIGKQVIEQSVGVLFGAAAVYYWKSGESASYIDVGGKAKSVDHKFDQKFDVEIDQASLMVTKFKELVEGFEKNVDLKFVDGQTSVYLDSFSSDFLYAKIHVSFVMGCENKAFCNISSIVRMEILKATRGSILQ